MIDLKQALRILGIRMGDRAFVGPQTVQIDLTDECNNNCVGCWARSPFLREEDNYDGLSKGTLDTAWVLNLIPDLKELGVEHIFLGGGGEPFCHMDIMRIIESFKVAKFQVTVNTNFTLLDEQRTRWLFDLRPDNLIVSLWAGTGETYSKLHPNKTSKTFERITENLLLLRRLKKENQIPTPRIKIYNVINRSNYSELAQMIRYGREVGVDLVEFAVFDPIPQRTDVFLLNPEQILFCQKFFENFVDNSPPEVHYRLFLRRLGHPDAVRGAYDNGIYLNTPCTAGWTYARITTVGEVHSCLKSHRIPVGNICKSSFRDIWFSEAQNEFRKNTIKIDVDNPYLKNIGHDIQFPLPGCFRICDNLGENLATNDFLHGLNDLELTMLSEMERKAGEGAGIPELELLYKRYSMQ